jgi:hypothetical protein
VSGAAPEGQPGGPAAGPLANPSRRDGASRGPDVGFAPGPWEALRDAPAWRGQVATLAASAEDLPGDGPWVAAILGRAVCLRAALGRGRSDAAVAAGARLGGLGEGSTPAGDDYLMGVLHALWAAGDASTLAPRLAGAAALATTTTSASWLRAAGRGEVGPNWRSLLLALAGGEAAAIAAAAAGVRSLGHTSGAFSLRGFLDTLEVLAP